MPSCSRRTKTSAFRIPSARIIHRRAMVARKAVNRTKMWSSAPNAKKTAQLQTFRVLELENTSSCNRCTKTPAFRIPSTRKLGFGPAVKGIGAHVAEYSGGLRIFPQRMGPSTAVPHGSKFSVFIHSTKESYSDSWGLQWCNDTNSVLFTIDIVFNGTVLKFYFFPISSEPFIWDQTAEIWANSVYINSLH